MGSRARGFFIAGSAGLALGGVLHFFGQFRGGDRPLALRAVEAAMRGYTIEGMGMSPSVMDIMQAWGAAFGVMAVFGGVQNLILASNSPRPLGLPAAWSALCAAVLVGIGFHYHALPPVVVFSLVFLCFAAATALAIKAGGA